MPYATKSMEEKPSARVAWHIYYHAMYSKPYIVLKLFEIKC